MPFHFPLAAVLKYRESIEHREHLALEKIHQEITAAETQIALVDSWRAAAIQQRAEELARGVPSIHLQGAYEHELALERYRDSLRGHLLELRQKLRLLVRSYEVARQKREILDEQRSRQFHAYTRERAKRQQNLLDDLFLARRKRAQ